MENVDETLLGLVQLNDAMGPLVCLLWVGAVAAGAIQNTVTIAVARLVVEGRIIDYNAAKQ